MGRVVFKATRFFYASHLLNPPSRFGQHVAKDFAAHLSTRESPWVETGAGNSMRRWRRMRIPAFELADLTAVWSEMLKRKKDWDLTVNGVNHPNDFGHRVYAQVICELMTP